MVKTKTEILYATTELMHKVKDPTLLHRCWTGIDRMLIYIDFKRSDSEFRKLIDYPYCVNIKGKEILDNLKSINKKEKNKKVKLFATTVINRLENKLY